MKKITEDGYTKFSAKKEGTKIKENDILAAFKLVDMDKSGEISKMVKLKNHMGPMTFFHWIRIE